METVDPIVPSPPPADQTPSGASGVQPTQPETASEPKPVVIDAPAHVAAVNSALFGNDIPDPTRPKEYTPEAFAAYENQVKGVERYRTFQREVREVVAKPVEIAPGVVHTFNNPKEVQAFAAFTQEKLSTGLTGRDLVILQNHRQLIADAERRGERNYEKRLKAGTQTAPVKTAPVVVPPADKASSSPNRTPTVREIMQQKFPDAYNKFVKGE